MMKFNKKFPIIGKLYLIKLPGHYNTSLVKIIRNTSSQYSYVTTITGAIYHIPSQDLYTY